MNKANLILQIIAQLNRDLDILFTAAKTAHEAATHEENQPDNKYDTLALEASYVAQGQANRAREIRKSIELYRQLQPGNQADVAVCLTSLVTLEDAEGESKVLFIGPAEGGLKIALHGEDIVVITPASPMGRALLGSCIGEPVTIEAGSSRTEYEIVDIR